MAVVLSMLHSLDWRIACTAIGVLPDQILAVVLSIFADSLQIGGLFRQSVKKLLEPMRVKELDRDHALRQKAFAKSISFAEAIKRLRTSPQGKKSVQMRRLRHDAGMLHSQDTVREMYQTWNHQALPLYTLNATIGAVFARYLMFAIGHDPNGKSEDISIWNLTSVVLVVRSNRSTSASFLLPWSCCGVPGRPMKCSAGPGGDVPQAAAEAYQLQISNAVAKPCTPFKWAL